MASLFRPRGGGDRLILVGWRTKHGASPRAGACGRPQATNLGLCAEHRVELFGLEAS